MRLAHPEGDRTGKTEYKYRPKIVWPDGRDDFGKQVNVKKGTRVAQSPRTALYRWICGKDFNGMKLPDFVTAHLAAMDPEASKKYRLGIIRDERLPWEAIPTEFLKDPDVWATMLPHMGMTALIRNLGAMTELGTLKPLTDNVKFVCRRLLDPDQLCKARIHPFNLLLAGAVYRSGQSVMGSRTWKPIPQIVDALNDAFYLSFKTIVPTGKRTLIGIDVSGSMSSPMMGSALEVCEGAAAMAMVTARVEENYHIMAFDNGMKELPITAKSSLAEVLKQTKDINGGGTDCSLPILYAAAKKIPVDVFQVYTDNETWAGVAHPVASLQAYRKHTGINAKLVVCGMTSTGFSIADPNDGGMLDVVGFDSNAPAVIADFVRDKDQKVPVRERDMDGE